MKLLHQNFSKKFSAGFLYFAGSPEQKNYQETATQKPVTKNTPAQIQNQTENYAQACGNNLEKQKAIQAAIQGGASQAEVAKAVSQLNCYVPIYSTQVAPRNHYAHGPTQTNPHHHSHIKSEASPLYDIKDPFNTDQKTQKTTQKPNDKKENQLKKEAQKSDPVETPEIQKLKKQIASIKSELALIDYLGEGAPYNREESEAKLKQLEKQLENEQQKNISSTRPLEQKTTPQKNASNTPINYQAEIKKRQDIAAKNPDLKPQMEKEIQILRDKMGGKKEKSQNLSESEKKAQEESQKIIEKNKELIEKNPEIAKSLDLSDTADDLENPQNLWELIAKLLKDLLEVVDGKTKIERIKEDINKFVEELPEKTIKSDQDFNVVLKKLKEKHPNISEEQLERYIESFSSEENHTETARMERRKETERKYNSGELKYKGENMGESEEYPGGYEQAAKDLRSNGIEIGSSGADKKGIIEDGSSSHKTRTCLKGIRNISIKGAIQLQRQLEEIGGSNLMIRGGTENKHSTKYRYSHQRGYKFDFRDNADSKNLFNSIAKEQGKKITYGNMPGTKLTLKNGQKIKVIYHGPDRHYDVTFYPSGEKQKEEKSTQTETTTPVKDPEGNPIKTPDGGNVVTENSTEEKPQADKTEPQKTKASESPQESTEKKPTNSYEKFTQDQEAIKPISDNQEHVQNMINQLEEKGVPYSYYAPILHMIKSWENQTIKVGEQTIKKQDHYLKSARAIQGYDRKGTTKNTPPEIIEKKNRSKENFNLSWEQLMNKPKDKLFRNPGKDGEKDKRFLAITQTNSIGLETSQNYITNNPEIISGISNPYIATATLYKETNLDPKILKYNHLGAMLVHLFKGENNHSKVPAFQKNSANRFVQLISHYHDQGLTTQQVLQHGETYKSNAIGALGLPQFMAENMIEYTQKINGNIKDLYQGKGVATITTEFLKDRCQLPPNIQWKNLKNIEKISQMWVEFDSRIGGVGFTGKNPKGLYFADYLKQNNLFTDTEVDYIAELVQKLFKYNHSSDDALYTLTLAKKLKEKNT